MDDLLEAHFHLRTIKAGRMVYSQSDPNGNNSSRLEADFALQEYQLKNTEQIQQISTLILDYYKKIAATEQNHLFE